MPNTPDGDQTQEDMRQPRLVVRIAFALAGILMLPLSLLFPSRLSTESITIHFIQKETGDYQVAGPTPSQEPHRSIKIVQLSDIHWDHRSSRIDRELLSNAINVANSFQPDLVLLTGDFVDYEPHSAEANASQLMRLESKNGVFAVLGNHDYKWSSRIDEDFHRDKEGHLGSRVVKAALESAGVKVLINQTEFPFGDDQVALVGLGDFFSPEYDPSKVMREDHPPIAPLTLVMSHNPDTAVTLAEFSFALQLSGHTHGGQIRIPYVKTPVVGLLGKVITALPIFLQNCLPYAIRRFNRVCLNWDWSQGLHEVKRWNVNGNNLLYTNRGLASHPPGRLFCDPEGDAVLGVLWNRAVYDSHSTGPSAVKDLGLAVSVFLYNEFIPYFKNGTTMAIRNLFLVSILFAVVLARNRPTSAPAPAFVSKVYVGDIDDGYTVEWQGVLYNDGVSRQFFTGVSKLAHGVDYFHQTWWLKQENGSVLRYSNSSLGCTYIKLYGSDFDWFSWVLDTPNSFFVPGGAKDAGGNPADLWKSRKEYGKPWKRLVVKNQDATVPVSYQQKNEYKYEFFDFKPSPTFDNNIFVPPAYCRKPDPPPL
ncbi:hypothetical protein PROFUN_14814 [Planoprotostelium fungivorum]|uniref:Calcineurin-like phosphoesterase domain-containing protein n=1 Tax=Planoprotostelium fungivorum TaxID=1890364 RepID=A0A2P6MYG1_9EUKA|nr:hypothetical protein PROFUN_14814 [Planoprotostelium fungivorum]